MNTIKNWIKKIPGSVALYTYFSDREAYRFRQKKARLYRGVTELHKTYKSTNLPRITCDQEGVWYVDDRDIKWLFDTSRRICAMGREQGHEHEPGILKVMRERLKPGAILCDVGANVGFFSVLMASQFKDLVVHAFEPVEATHRLLSKNVSRNGLSGRVFPHRVALGDRDDNVTITNDQTTGNHLVQQTSGSDGSLESVNLSTLDTYLPSVQCNRVDFVKCDIEGAEMGFLRGAVNTLRKWRPEVIIEVEPQWLARMGSTPQQIFGFFKELGYDCAPIFDDGQIGERNSDPMLYLDRANNFICLPRP